jgi:hypothetical protein
MRRWDVLEMAVSLSARRELGRIRLRDVSTADQMRTSYNSGPDRSDESQHGSMSWIVEGN